MIKEKEKTNHLEVDLTGPQGNAFYLLSLTKRLSDMCGIDHKPIVDQMTSGDYENLVRVFDRHFGSFVTLYR